ncbi:hypothetical protein AWB67_05621 [Caballeronia terrestris]|uniref:DUF4129 domain-containing protein n=1 Tax=Caballeronia terrestris TaxID=1226301 RepID=A0A158KI24_9BURK|nr:hypothetical protein [Caballeronia terrestris]SAL80429.1 hypothetical protein AWB67_05621 [Caballeronia terrestris]
MRKLLLLLCTIPSLSFASNWIVVHKADENWLGPVQDQKVKIEHSEVSVSVDRDSIASNGQVKSVWWKETASTKGFAMDMIRLTAFDCQAHTGLVQRAGAREKFSDPYKWYEDVRYEQQRIVPDSDWDSVFSAVCLSRWGSGSRESVETVNASGNEKASSPSAYPASSSDYAAWVQAFGSIGAIIAAALIAIWQSKKTVQQINQQKVDRDAERLVTVHSIVYTAVVLQRSVTQQLRQNGLMLASPEERIGFMPDVLRLEKALDQIELHLLPNGLVQYTLKVSATFTAFRILLEQVLSTSSETDEKILDDYIFTLEAFEWKVQDAYTTIEEILMHPANEKST